MTLELARPWLAITILWVAFFTFGWSAMTVEVAGRSPILTVLAAIAIGILLAAALNLSVRSSQTLAAQVVATDVRSFFTIVLCAFLGVVLISWVEVTSYLLILLAAQALTRLELRLKGFPSPRIFWIASGVSTIGISCAALLQWALLFQPVVEHHA